MGGSDYSVPFSLYSKCDRKSLENLSREVIWSDSHLMFWKDPLGCWVEKKTDYMHADTKGEAEKPGRETRQDSMGEGGGLGQAVSIINEK